MAAPLKGVLDAFTRANEKPIVGSWVNFRGLNTGEVLGNLVNLPTSKLYGGLWNPTEFSGHVEAFLDIVVVGAPWVEVWCCASGTESPTGYSFEWEEGVYRLVKTTAGTKVSLATFTAPLVAGDAIWLDRDPEGHLKGYRRHEGVWTLMCSATDTAFTTGKIGWSARSTTVAWQLDNFGGGSYVSVGAPVGAAAAVGVQPKLKGAPLIIGTNDGTAHGEEIAHILVSAGIISNRINLSRGDSPTTSAGYGYSKPIFIVGNTTDTSLLSTVNITTWVNTNALPNVEAAIAASGGAVALCEVGNEMYFKGPQGSYQQKEPVKYAEMFMALHNKLVELGLRSKVKLLFNAWGDYRLSEAGAFSQVSTKNGWLGDALAAQSGLKTAVDGFTGHPYGKPKENSENNGGPGATIAQHTEAVELGFTNTDFWITEFGVMYPGSTGTASKVATTEAEQNSWVKEVYEELAGSGFVRGIWWFSSYDNESGTEKWGLFKGTSGAEGKATRAIVPIIAGFGVAAGGLVPVIGSAAAAGLIPKPTFRVPVTPGNAPAAGVLGSGAAPPPVFTHRRTLTALGEDMRDSLPPILRESPDYLAVIHALAKECERVQATIEIVRRQFNPAKASLLLGVWERITKQTVAPAGRSELERQTLVTNRLRKMLALGFGSAWQEQVTLIVGPGWTYEEHDAGKGGSPTEGSIRIKLPFESADSRYLDAVSAVREITPAHLLLSFESAGGFVLDETAMDLGTLTV